MELYKQKRGKFWWVAFHILGERFRVSTKQVTKTAARTAAERIVSAAEQGIDPRGVRPGLVPGLSAYAPVFLEYIDRTQLDPDTKRYYRTGCRLLLATPLSARRLDRISSSDASALALPGSGANANCALRTLRRLLSYAADQQLILSAPRIHLRKEREREAIITPELEAQLLAFAQQPFRDAFLLMHDSGMRPDEVIRMTWDDVLWDVALYFNRSGKTKRARRHVPLSTRALTALRARLAAQQGMSTPWVFPSVRRNKAGERSHIRAFGLSKEWTRLRELLSIPREIVPYSARHSFATDLMDRVGGNIVLVGDVLGHADLKTTRRYIHPSGAGVAALIDARNNERSSAIKNAILPS